MIQIFEFENFLKKRISNSIIEYFNTNIDISKFDENKHFWDGRIIPSHNIHNDKFILRQFRIILYKATQLASNFFDEKYIFPEYSSIVYWKEGMSMKPHADNCTLEGYPNSSPYRDYSSICYLNDFYEGGTTYFPKLNYEVVPKKGKIVFFPSGLDYLHGVSEIKNGSRYTISIWWTKTEEKFLEV